MPHPTSTPSRRRAPDPGCPTPRAHRPPAAPAGRVARRASAGHRAPLPYRTADLPLAIWPCAQTTSQWQRHGRYSPESNRHPGKMLPALARRAIETYSDPGDLVLDPMCGIGTTLVEAIHLHRRALGLELEPRWAKLARANIHHARHHGAREPARVIEGDAQNLTRLLAGHTRRAAGGGVDLILTSPPYACQVADVAKENLRSGLGPIRRDDTTNYSPDRANLGHARGGAYLAAMAGVYHACAAVLKPGGYLVLATKDMRSGGALRNLSGETITLCEETGLHYWQRIIALLATVRDAEIVMRPSFWQTLQVRKARARGDRTHVVAHEDVLVFRKPAAAAPCAAARRPRR
ncbi:MAG TPA: DNA methyltransferase [Solirubrobacteraceae bacterium]|jgi:modification methylase|nr:DNA methyltransferase [Solirubrobacteraceae bacterium]